MRALRGGEILIVETDAAFAQRLGVALEQSGHHVTQCAGIEQSRAQLERVAFDVVLCAEALPDGKGRSLADWLKNNAEFPELQRVSFALVTAGDSLAAPTPVALPEVNLPLATRKGLLSGFLRGGGSPDARSAPQSTGVGAAMRMVEPPFLDNDAASSAPDDVISRASPLLEVVQRVQILLRLRRYLDEIGNTVAALMSVAEGIEEQDRRGRGHCKRLSVMALELGAVMGCDEWQLTALERAAYLHDIGKISIPGALISKTDALTPREMEIIQTHCALGEKICQPVAALAPVLPIIRHHHERANGTGYPDGLRSDEIPILSQIFSIPDIYDALRMWRPYRGPMIELQAVNVMRQEVNQGYWNRHIFDAFVTSVLPGLDARLDSYHVLWPPS